MTGDGRPGDHRRSRGGRRRLVVACVLLAAGGLAMWGATALTWFTAPAASSATRVTLAGSAVQPVPVGVGLLVLAGAAAAVAVSGPLRRVLGAALVLAAIGGAVAAVSTALSGPDPARLAALAGAAVAPGAAVSGTPAPLLALAGAVAAVAGGLVLIVREGDMPRLGARYAAPAKTRPADPDRAAWDELDAGHDPTADDADGADRPPRNAPTRPGGEPGESDV